jgi:hypothetical protein
MNPVTITPTSDSNDPAKRRVVQGVSIRNRASEGVLERRLRAQTGVQAQNAKGIVIG